MNDNPANDNPMNDNPVPGNPANGSPATRDPATGNPATFDDLVTAATVGVSRKPPPLSELEIPPAARLPASSDPAAALLDAAALHTVAARAGYEPPRGITPPEAPHGTTPAFSARAARALREACGWQAGRFPADNPLLPDLLRSAAKAGYAAYPALLPALLDAAARRTALREPVAAVLGPHGRWLARHRPDWRPVAESAAGPDSTAGPDSAADSEAWRTGRPAERLACLTRLRATDPDAARDLLAEGWSAETGSDRGQLIAVLDRGLSLADEPFLEGALDDRASAVRVTARRMLGRLPGSAFGRRASTRAEDMLRLERRGQRSGLVAVVPPAPDAAALRDGLNVSPPEPSAGARAWQLTQVIAAAPLAGWTARFGLSLAEIVALPVADGLGADVHAGWRFAAVAQANADWARALLAATGPDGRTTPHAAAPRTAPRTAPHAAPRTSDPGLTRPPAAWPPDQVLAALLPPAERAARLAAGLADVNLATVNPPGWAARGTPLLEEIRDWPGPWPPVLADAVLSALARVNRLPTVPSAARMLLNASGRGLPAAGDRDYERRLARMAEACPHAWEPGLRAAAETVAMRRIFAAEIGGSSHSETGARSVRH